MFLNTLLKRVNIKFQLNNSIPLNYKKPFRMRQSYQSTWPLNSRKMGDEKETIVELNNEYVKKAKHFAEIIIRMMT